jgi:hypothetical protein
MAKGMKVYDQEDEVVAEFNAIERKGDRLIVDGKALGYMRMDMIFTLDEVLKGLRLALCWPVISYVLLLPFFIIRNLFRKKPTKEADSSH